MRVFSCSISFLCWLFCTVSAAADRPSIHARELQAWNDVTGIHWQTFDRERMLRHKRPLTRLSATHTHEVLGFHPYWMGSRYLAYDWSILSTVVFFALEIDATGGVTDDHGWPWTDLVQEAHQNGARVLLAATQFSSSDLTTLLGSASHRSNAVSNIVNAIVDGAADGACIDFEGVPGSRKQQFVDFVDELRSALDVTLPGSKIVVTTPAVDWNNAYDYDEIAANSDYLMLMAYDYHWSGSSTSGPVAPLDGWGTYDVSWSIQDHVIWGAPRQKLLLGVPYYGYRWSTVDESPGASTTSSGTALTYAGVQASLSGQTQLWDSPSQTPWMRQTNPDWQQTWFDDASSLAAKYYLAKFENLAGIGIWALGYDDLHVALWNQLHDSFDQVTSDTGTAPRDQLLTVNGRNPFRHEAVVVYRHRTEPAAPAFGSEPSSPEFGPQPMRPEPFLAEALLYLEIIDVRGRRIRTLAPAHRTDGQSIYRWDGKNHWGSSVPAGVYFARLRQRPQLGTVRLLRLPPSNR